MSRRSMWQLKPAVGTIGKSVTIGPPPVEFLQAHIGDGLPGIVHDNAADGRAFWQCHDGIVAAQRRQLQRSTARPLRSTEAGGCTVRTNDQNADPVQIDGNPRSSPNTVVIRDDFSFQG